MRALVIEDDLAVQKALERGFQSKYALFDGARDGKLALQKLSSTTYDVLIVDLMLPHVDGEKIIQKIRSVGIKTPVLVLTAMRSPEVKARLLDLGADDFLEKPFSFEELYARVGAIMRRFLRGSMTKALKIRDLELFPESNMAVRSGKEIPLRGKEYVLLEFMMQNPNRILSRQSLMEKVWGYSTNILSNTVDSHVSTLRRKIDKGFEFPFIKTIHGVGYMFVGDSK